MKILRFMEGFLLGAAIGGLLSLLLTPESGDQLRGRISAEVGRIQSEIRSAASERRSELESQLTSLRTPPKSV